MVGRLRFALVREDRRAAGLLPAPSPGVAASCELLRTDIALTVKEVRAVLLAGRVVAEDLRSAHIEVSDAAIGGVQHKKTTRHPFIHIAGQNLHGGRSCACDGLPLVDPLTDKDLQALVLGSWLDT